MNEIFEKYLKIPLKYEKLSGPDKISSIDDAKKYGINCGALVHILINELFKIEFPKELMCIELSYDQEYFKDATDDPDIKLGDISILAKEGISQLLKPFESEYISNGRISDFRKHPRIHLLMYTGETDSLGSPLLIHSNPHSDNAIEISTLEKIMRHKNYEQEYKICRLREDFLA